MAARLYRRNNNLKLKAIKKSMKVKMTMMMKIMTDRSGILKVK
jgi:hypothetical protein